jgi:hypothetical protein
MSTVRGPSRLRAGSQERSAPPSGGRGEHTESTEADGGSKHRVIVEPSGALARRSSAKEIHGAGDSRAVRTHSCGTLGFGFGRWSPQLHTRANVTFQRAIPEMESPSF